MNSRTRDPSSSGKTVAIVQSNYLPWRGYFDLIDEGDLFVFLDDVQYTRRDWRNRNLIKTSDGLRWLSVPVHFSRNDNTPIQGTLIDYGRDWVSKHIHAIRSAYGKAPFFKTYSGDLFDILSSRPDTISELNIRLIRWIMAHLTIRTELKMSRDFSPEGKKTGRLLDILKKAGATRYVSGPSAQAYLEKDQFRDAGIALEYKRYDLPEYPQNSGTFEPRVSTIDLLFNCGPDSTQYFKSRVPAEKPCQ
ncbi:MAG: WbqC family protein [Nitrospinales bacterium]